ncbi:RNA binding protein Rnp24, putative [Trichophyton verrucosum HKI 0517]|uniref:RNA binding protein Rnp24, putative n=1 Tax=Trichophyton verrucosum (strain HKI 0517) TaxID=663202 RepID=D4DJI8_TRIVH|nr:RNA binding protein Rnp24, putative [Trichophyton verrucosum HKI 0517]EFE38021.1 RNA binding protein Rnp24, putative [Trichophyton verrucosum HKI 0517]
MSDSSSSSRTPSPQPSRKRKHVPDEPPLEIDLNAPEPASKKALRKEKKAKIKSSSSGTTVPAVSEGTEKGNETQKPEKNDSNKKQRTGFGVWIGNLPFTATRETLRTFLTSKSGILDSQITRVHIPDSGTKRKGVKQNKGFAYVDFTSQEIVERAIALSEELVGGRRVLIKDATNFDGRVVKEADGDDLKTAGGNPPSTKIFVGNLSFDTTKEHLEEHFSPCGSISNIHVATFEDSGKCKGYAWVEFESTQSSQAAVRGFVKIPDPDDEIEEAEEEVEEEEEEEDGAEGANGAGTKKKPKKRRMKKVWVNRLQGRNLRMEFAEDSTTRYKKRFGKEKTETKEEAGSNNRPASEATQGSVNLKQKSKKPIKSYGQYSTETVQKLSGAIVEAKGTKVTFD